MAAKQSMQPAPAEVAPKSAFGDFFDRFEKLNTDIANRAFELFRNRGGEIGSDLADWLKAETELLGPITIDVTLKEKEVEVKAEMPGFEAKNIEVFIEPKRLSIRGKRETSEEKKEGEQVLTERSASEVFRRLVLPARVDPASAVAKLEKGILTLTIPRVVKPEPTKVDITEG